MSDKLKNILVPTDFSDCANTAADVALEIAKKSMATVLFLHLAVEHSPQAHVPTKSLPSVGSGERGQARFQLDQLVSAACAKGVVAKPELVLGTGFERVEHYVEPFGIDLLVMGSHGATGIRESIIGSRTQHVVHNIQIPSLVVKHRPNKAIPKDIVFASTFKQETSFALSQVVKFCRLWDATLHLLFINLMHHLIDEDVANAMMAKEAMRHPNLKFTKNISQTTEKEFGVAQFAQQIDADMIAVSAEGKRILGRMLNPGLAERLINHSPLPILVVRPE